MSEQQTPVVPLTPHRQLRMDVAEKLSTSGVAVRDLVVGELYEQTIQERKTAVIAVLNKVDQLQKDLKKAQSQGTAQFALSGNVVGEPIFTKQQIDEIRKIQESIDKHNAALTAAFEKSDFNKLLELAK